MNVYLFSYMISDEGMPYHDLDQLIAADFRHEIETNMTAPHGIGELFLYARLMGICLNA